MSAVYDSMNEEANKLLFDIRAAGQRIQSLQREWTWMLTGTTRKHDQLLSDNSRSWEKP
jgi:hypothetical protein